MSKIIYKVTLGFENIEAGGGRKFTKDFNLEADDYISAIKSAIHKLGSNRDGKLLSIYAVAIFID